MKSNKSKHNRLIALLCLIAMLCAITLCPPTVSGAAEKAQGKHMAVAYITSWNWRNDIDATKLTHINYAFGMVSADASVSIQQESNINKLVALKADNPDLKILLSMQQVAAGDFCKLAQTQQGREAFAQNCKNIVDKFGIDGIDVDWEYPGYNIATGEITCPNCKNDFTALLKEIRSAIGEDKLLTIACGVSEYLQHYTDFPAINPYLDFFNVMAYDFQVGNINGHQSNLYPGSAGGEGWGLTGDAGIRLLMSKGIPAEKLNLGVPFYSRTNTGGEYRYAQIQSFLSQGYVYNFDEAAQQSYLTKNGEFAVAYDDARTIRCKAEYVKEMGLGGLMCWEYGQDDAQNTLMNAVWDGLNASEPEEELPELKLSLDANASAAVGQTYSMQAKPEGGDGEYSFAVYVLKDGRRIYENQLSASADFAFTPQTAGEYLICLYCFDGAGSCASANAGFTAA